MKRRRESEESEVEVKPSKHTKYSHFLEEDPFFDATSRRYISNVVRNPTDESGFIVCQVFMQWRNPYIRLIVRTEEDAIGSDVANIEIHFLGRCLEALQQHGVRFDVSDEFLLTLKGFSLSQGEKGKIILKYSQGTHIMFTKRRRVELECEAVDTWKVVDTRDDPLTADWYDAPVVRPAPLKDSSSKIVESFASNGDHSFKPVENDPAKQKSSKQRHKDRMKERKAKKAAKSNDSSSTLVPPDKVSSVPTTSKTLSGTELLIESYLDALKAIPSGDPGGKVKWGYTSLNQVRQHAQISTVGVVVAAREIQKPEGRDLYRSFRIVDPTSYEPADIHYQNPQAVSVNYFTKQFDYWLPAVQENDVVILTGLKSNNFHDRNTLTSMHNQTKWAIYSRSSSSVHYGANVNASENESSSSVSPFYEPLEVELRCCQLLSEWWDIVQEKQKELSSVANVVGLDYAGARGVVSRPHLRIQDLDPNRNRGFFDCTVEVLHGYPEPDGQRYYTLYVTDYTSSDCLTEVQAEWCPKSLSRSVLRIEMWDSSRELGQEMTTGAFYSLKNVRVKYAPNGLLEGRLQERKATLLTNEMAEYHQDLKALIGRKEIWKAKHGQSEVKFESLSLSDVVLDKFFNCIVEVLYCHLDNKRPYICVTDYTYNDYLVESYEDFVSEPWAKELRGCILKVYLHDNQVRDAKKLKPGEFCVIQKTRIKPGYAGKKPNAFLGGSEQKIRKLNTSVPADKDKIDELLGRKEIGLKEGFLPRVDTMLQTTETTVSRSATAPVPPSKVSTSVFTIREMKKVDSCPNKYRLSARVVDYRPLSLRNAVHRICSACDNDIPDTQKACVKCNDFNHEYIRFVYGLSLIIEDTEGTRVRVDITDKYKEEDPDECPLLKGLKRVSLEDDEEAYEQFCQLFERFAGNAQEYYEKRSSSLATPFRSMTIVALPDPDSKDGRTYYLWNVDGAYAT
ncbi:hypothetical protein K435DRAFT_511358 [Dendrothele bispora CBS 962.96]|uniref:Protection of telomeres protein 1 n=1 Tax=Dendrothele bispora (strain CBS 962.96) TaxID=1314807 RepID=A0A4V4HBN9_DENBC|nr:hypothetical protein K435DRAFT_511358 [Dendrothele bispora CBS 962.96]